MRGEQKKNQTNSFSRSRALGVIVLVLGLFLFQVAVFVFERREEDQMPDLQAEKKYPQKEEIDSRVSSKENKAGKENRAVAGFKFNPNTISADSLCLLGFSDKQAASIIKYRQKGGIFRKKEDFAKLYVVNDYMYNKLSGYIVIEKESIRQKIEIVGKDTGRIVKKLSAKPVERADRRLEDTLRKKRPAIVELNSADSAALVSLYGIGGYYAKKILDYRARVGNFYAPEQLMEVEGIDSTRYSGFAGRIKVDPISVKKFSLDTAGKYFLMKHPYIGAYAARGIIFMREKFGAQACSLENLVKERIITAEMAKKLWFYVE